MNELAIPSLDHLERLHHRVMRSTVRYRLARGTAWAFIGTIVSRALMMVTTVVVARLLGPKGYGEVGMVQSTISLFGVVAGFGLGSAATKHIAEFRLKNPGRAARVCNLTLVAALVPGTAMTLVCWAFSNWLATKILHQPDLSSLVASASLLLFISSIGGVQLAALAGFEAFRKIAAINCWQAIAALVVSVPCVLWFGIEGAIAACTISTAVGSMFSSLALRREYRNYQMSGTYSNGLWKEWPCLWNFAFPALLAALMQVQAIWLTNLILVRQPRGYGELGLFNAANQWRMAIIFLPSLLASVVLPVLAETYGRDVVEFRRTVSLNVSLVWIVALPITIAVVGLANPLATMFGKSYVGVRAILPALMLSCFFNVVAGTVGAALASVGRMWIGMLMNLGWAIALVGSSALLTPLWGARGLAVAYLLAYVLHILWSLLYLELKLVPGTLSREWQLWLFSIILLSLTLGITFRTGGQRLWITGALVVVSLVPMLVMSYRVMPPRLQGLG